MMDMNNEYQEALHYPDNGFGNQSDHMRLEWDNCSFKFKMFNTGSYGQMLTANLKGATGVGSN